MATTQRPLARRCLDDFTGEPAWETAPSWYQVSAQDRMIPPPKPWDTELSRNLGDLRASAAGGLLA
jgi:hypothetical protein